MDDVALTETICRFLAAVPGWVYDEGGPETTRISYGSNPPDPDQAIAVRVYGSPTDDPETGLTRRRVQLRVRGGRGDRTGADSIAELCKTVLHGRVRGDGISSIYRTSFGPLGADDNDREERSENYIITLDNLEASS